MKKAILIEKYSHLYDSHYFMLPLIGKVLHDVLPHHHHNPIIKTDVEVPDFDTLTEAEQVNRALYALWKIRQVNHHFFSPLEEETLDNRPLRIARYTFKYSMYAIATGYFAFTVMANRLSALRLAKTAGVFIGTKAALFGCEAFYDKVKMPSRRALARKYIDIYGAKTLFEISKPGFPVEHIEHLHNKSHY